MLNTILIDAGPLIALFDKDDKYHGKIKQFLRGKRLKYITTNAVITEVTYMLNFSIEVQILFFEWVMKEGVLIQEIQQHDIGRIVELTKKYRDRPMDYADATLVVAAEKTGITQIISLDSDFDMYRLPKKVRIENIFKE